MNISKGANQKLFRLYGYVLYTSREGGLTSTTINSVKVDHQFNLVWFFFDLPCFVHPTMNSIVLIYTLHIYLFTHKAWIDWSNWLHSMWNKTNTSKWHHNYFAVQSLHTVQENEIKEQQGYHSLTAAPRRQLKTFTYRLDFIAYLIYLKKKKEMCSCAFEKTNSLSICARFLHVYFHAFFHTLLSCRKCQRNKI